MMLFRSILLVSSLVLLVPSFVSAQEDEQDYKEEEFENLEEDQSVERDLAATEEGVIEEFDENTQAKETKATKAKVEGEVSDFMLEDSESHQE